MRKIISILALVTVLSTMTPVVNAADINTIEIQGQAALAIKEPAPKKPIQGDEIVATALKYKGVRYKFGGDSPQGFDCSGFVWYVFDKHGKALPRTADKQFEVGKSVATKELKPGDVVFFTTYEKGASHCGIYVGDGKFVHASSSRGVMVSQLAEKYWQSRYLGARRMI